MAKSNRAVITWTVDPAAHDYPAAESYLRLLTGPGVVDGLIGALRTAPPQQQQAKDILRRPGCRCSARTTPRWSPI